MSARSRRWREMREIREMVREMREMAREIREMAREMPISRAASRATARRCRSSTPT